MLPQVICYSRGDKIPEGYKIINTTSHSKEQWSKNLSPFYLGPITVNPTGNEEIHVNKFENAWQYLKVYEDQYDVESDTIKPNWFEWANDGFRNKQAVRFPRGKGAKPLFSINNGQKMGYIEARLKIYAPLYEDCVRRYAANEYAILKRMCEDGEKLALFDFDGYAHYSKNLSLEDVMYNEKKKMGHSFVLMSMMEYDLYGRDKPWEKPYNPEKIKSIYVGRT